MTETPPEPRSPSPHGRTYLIALLLIAAAGFGGVWALSQPWVTAVTNAGFGDEPVTVAGSTLYPLSVAGAWLGLAGAVAVIATAGSPSGWTDGVLAEQRGSHDQRFNSSDGRVC